MEHHGFRRHSLIDPVATFDIEAETSEATIFVQGQILNYLKAICIGNFACVPAAYVLAWAGQTWAICVLMLLQAWLGGYFQHKVLKQLEFWLESTGRHRYKCEAIFPWAAPLLGCLPGVYKWQFWLLRGLPEYYDPTSDASQAGRANHALSPQADHIFKESWQHVPLLGWLVGKLHLSGVLTLLLLIASVVQVCTCFVYIRQATVFSKHITRSGSTADIVSTPPGRMSKMQWTRYAPTSIFDESTDNGANDNVTYFGCFWSDLCHAADAASVVLLADVFQKLALRDRECLESWERDEGDNHETEYASQWALAHHLEAKGTDAKSDMPNRIQAGNLRIPVDRAMKFVTKIFAEGAFYMWFQVSLLALSYDDSTTIDIALNILSICFSIETILEAILEQIFFLCDLLPRKDTKLTAKFNQVASLVITLSLVSASIPRLVGVWVCPEHLLNLTPTLHCVHVAAST